MLLEEIEKDLTTDWWSTLAKKEQNFYAKRDNCGPAVIDFIHWSKLDLKRIHGYFKVDIPVSAKKDFTANMKREMLSDGFYYESSRDRYVWISHSKYAEEWKRIPHYWAIDNTGKIYDPTGLHQFILTGLAKDLNSERYQIT